MDNKSQWFINLLGVPEKIIKKKEDPKILESLEAVYPGNIGFQEMTKFYQTATPEQIKQMEKIVKKGDFGAFKNLIKKVIGVKLK